MTTTNSPAPATKALRLRDICNSLGIYDSKAQRSCRNCATKWRQGYITKSGRLGTKLCDWNFINDQEELKLMAVAFLSDAQNVGLWNRLKVKPGPSYFKYAVLVFQWGLGFEFLIMTRAIEGFMQLFWRQNRYAAHYDKYNRAGQYQDHFQFVDWKQDNRQNKRPETSGSDHKTITDKEPMEQSPPSRQNKRQKTSGTDHDFITDERPVEQSSPSQQCNPAPSLEPPRTGAVAQSPIESPPSQVQCITTTQPKVKIPFFIVLNIGEITRQTFWEEGSIGSKSLEEFLFSLATNSGHSPNDIERIKLVLWIETLEIVWEMEDRSERSWLRAIATFKVEIKRATTKGSGKLEGVKMLVEPVMVKHAAEVECAASQAPEAAETMCPNVEDELSTPPLQNPKPQKASIDQTSDHEPSEEPGENTDPEHISDLNATSSTMAL